MSADLYIEISTSPLHAGWFWKVKGPDPYAHSELHGERVYADGWAGRRRAAERKARRALRRAEKQIAYHEANPSYLIAPAATTNQEGQQ